MNITKVNDRKHILHLTYDMEIGGAEQVIKQLIAGLDPLKFSNSVLCINNTVGPMGRELEKSGIKHHVMSRQPGLDLSLIRDIRKLINDYEVDILHCHQYTPYTYGVLAALMTSKRVIYTEHGRFYPDSYSWKRRLVNPFLNTCTEAITAISVATKSALVQYEWFPVRSIQVIYNGIERTTNTAVKTDVRAECGFSEEHVILGTISRLDPIKNQEMMINAFKLVHAKHPEIRLLIVGDGPERDRLKNQVSALALNHAVHFSGFKQNPKPYLDIIDVFLLSSHSEGTSMTLLEAMADAKPSVVTAVGGNPEILEHGKSGLIVHTDDTAAFANAIIELINDKTLYDSISKNANEQFNAKFDLRFMIESYQNLYSS